MKHIHKIKKAIVFLGEIDEEDKMQPQATGFIISVDNLNHLVTAKHVIVDPKTKNFSDDRLFVFSNMTNGKIRATSIDKWKREHGLKWIFHQEENVDIALIPFGSDRQADDIMVVPTEIFLSPAQLEEGFDIFFLSFQPGTDIEKKVSPILRGGTISLMNDKTMLVDAAAFPGNSGSPVFLKPSVFRYDDEGVLRRDNIGGGFIGVIGSYIPYLEEAVSAQTGHVRVIFEENTGLSRVWSVPFMNEIIQSRHFKDQVNSIPKHLI